MAAGKEEQTSLSFPENNILRVYNQYPRRYSGGIPEMIDDLQRIADMGFNAVWINPVQSVGNYKNDKGEYGSMYAMSDAEELNPDFFPKGSTNEERDSLLKEYVQAVKNLNMIPLFDLVLRHVGCAVESEKTPLERKFKNHLYAAEPRRWPDTRAFKYSKKKNKKGQINDWCINYVMNNLWKPFITKYICGYGFMGIRVDAVANLERQVMQEAFSHTLTKCREAHGTQAVIMGELMAANPHQHIKKLQAIGFTHIFSSGAFYWNFSESEHPHPVPPWLNAQVHTLQEITQENGGVVCFGGNHDTGTLKSNCLFESKKLDQCLEGELEKKLTRLRDNPRERNPRKFLKGITPEIVNTYNLNEKDDNIDLRMREKLFYCALMGNGGWYLLAGDEYGVVHRPMVFSTYQEPVSYEGQWGATENLTDFIKNLNSILNILPAASQGDKCFTRRIVNSSDAPVESIIRWNTKTNVAFLIILMNSELEIDLSELKNAVIEKFSDSEYDPDDFLEQKIDVQNILEDNCFIMTSKGDILNGDILPQSAAATTTGPSQSS